MKNIESISDDELRDRIKGVRFTHLWASQISRLIDEKNRRKKHRKIGRAHV